MRVEAVQLGEACKLVFRLDGSGTHVVAIDGGREEAEGHARVLGSALAADEARDVALAQAIGALLDALPRCEADACIEANGGAPRGVAVMGLFNRREPWRKNLCATCGCASVGLTAAETRLDAAVAAAAALLAGEDAS